MPSVCSPSRQVPVLLLLPLLVAQRYLFLYYNAHPFSDSIRHGRVVLCLREDQLTLDGIFLIIFLSLFHSFNLALRDPVFQPDGFDKTYVAFF